MNAPASLTQRNNLKDRLETALKSGVSAEELTNEISSACAASPNAAWEALALIDQHYRRRHITQDVYRVLKAHVERLALGRPAGSERPAAASPAARTQRERPAAPAAPPATDARPSVDLRETTGRHAAVHATPAAELPPPDKPQPLGPPRPGLVLRGRYRLEARLDYGNGVVFQALDEFRKELPDEEQRVAIRFPADAGDAQREFFRAQHLSHPNIARVIEFDRDGDTAFYTIELQHGRLLRDVLKHAEHLPLPQPEALAIVRDIAAALEHAHLRGVVHGRLDNSSVLIVQDGGVRVLNFGLPRRGGEVLEPSDDLRSLCLIAYELLAGQPAFDGHSPGDARVRRLRLRRPPGLHRTQWRALQRGLAASDKGRNVTIDQWLLDMEVRRASGRKPAPLDLMHVRPPPAWPRWLLLVGVLTAFTVALVTVAVNWQSLMRNPAGGGPSGAATAVTERVAPIGRGAEPPAGNAAPLAAPATASASAAAAPAVDSAESAPAGAAPTVAAAGSSPPVTVTPASPVVAPPLAPPAATADGGAGLLAFQAESFTVAPGVAAARIPVRRTGGTRGDVGFVWWTESSSARAGDDFVSFGEQRELIPNGEKSVSLYVPLSGGARTSETEFYVNIGEPSGGARLGSIARLKVIIAAD